MDAANRFETRTTYRLLRPEYLVGLVVSVVLFGMHFGHRFTLDVVPHSILMLVGPAADLGRRNGIG